MSTVKIITFFTGQCPTPRKIGGVFAIMRDFLEELPDGRQKTAAITALEEAAIRAACAADGVEEPLRAARKE